MMKRVSIAVALAIPISLGAQAATSAESRELLVNDSAIVWAPGVPEANQRLVDGRVLRTLEAHGVYIAALVQANKKPLAVRLLVRNKGPRAFDFVPDSIGLEQNLPSPRVLKYWPPTKVKKDGEGYSVAEALLLGLASFGEGYAAAQGTKTTGTATASGGGGLTRIDYEETTRQPPSGGTAAATAALNAEKELKAASQLKGIILANTLDPGAAVDGVVYFDQPDRKALSLLIRIPAAGRVFVLPLDVPRR